MAGRTLNRRVLREQADQAEQLATIEPGVAPVAIPRARKTKAKTAAVPKVRKPRAKKAPPRMRARWGVFDGAMKQVAIFDYSERAAADEKLADLLIKKKGSHFLQIVKDAMPEPELPEAAAAVG
jgi:hypothetical protein